MAILEYRLPRDVRHFAVLARYQSPGELLRACERVRDARYTRWDAHSPFPVHGLERAMGLRPSILPWFVLAAALGGALGGFGLQAWVHADAYPLTISGKPLFAWPAYMPVTFELGVLGGALAAVLGLFGLSQLPTPHHPLFNSETFERAGDDGFFISIECWDPMFDVEETQRFLRGTGASSVEVVDL